MGVHGESPARGPGRGPQGPLYLPHRRHLELLLRRGRAVARGGSTSIAAAVGSFSIVCCSDPIAKGSLQTVRVWLRGSTCYNFCPYKLLHDYPHRLLQCILLCSDWDAAIAA